MENNIRDYLDNYLVIPKYVKIPRNFQLETLIRQVNYLDAYLNGYILSDELKKEKKIPGYDKEALMLFNQKCINEGSLNDEYWQKLFGVNCPCTFFSRLGFFMYYCNLFKCSKEEAINKLGEFVRKCSEKGQFVIKNCNIKIKEENCNIVKMNQSYRINYQYSKDKRLLLPVSRFQTVNKKLLGGLRFTTPKIKNFYYNFCRAPKKTSLIFTNSPEIASMQNMHSQFAWGIFLNNNVLRSRENKEMINNCKHVYFFLYEHSGLSKKQIIDYFFKLYQKFIDWGISVNISYIYAYNTESEYEKIKFDIIESPQRKEQLLEHWKILDGENKYILNSYFRKSKKIRIVSPVFTEKSLSLIYGGGLETTKFLINFAKSVANKETFIQGWGHPVENLRVVYIYSEETESMIHEIIENPTFNNNHNLQFFKIEKIETLPVDELKRNSIWMNLINKIYYIQNQSEDKYLFILDNSLLFEYEKDQGLFRVNYSLKDKDYNFLKMLKLNNSAVIFADTLRHTPKKLINAYIKWDVFDNIIKFTQNKNGTLRINLKRFANIPKGTRRNFTILFKEKDGNLILKVIRERALKKSYNLSIPKKELLSKIINLLKSGDKQRNIAKSLNISEGWVKRICAELKRNNYDLDATVVNLWKKEADKLKDQS